MEKKGKLLLFVSALIILYTEILGANMNFSLTYLPIVIAIIALVILNIRFKITYSSPKVVIVTNVLIILIDSIINIIYYLLFNGILAVETVKLSTLLPIAVLAYNLDKVDFSRFNKDYFIGLAKYFILPLLVTFTLEQAYIFFITNFGKIFSNDYISDVLLIVFRVILADITFVLLGLSLNDSANTNFNSDIITKTIFSSVIIIVLIVLILKLFMLISCYIAINDEVKLLKGVYPADEIEDYNNLDIYGRTSNDITQEEKEDYSANLAYAQNSFNELFTANAYDYMYKYRLNISDVNSKLRSKDCSTKQALVAFNNYTEQEINSCIEIQSNLILQIVSVIIIYSANIAGIAIVYKTKESI